MDQGDIIQLTDVQEMDGYTKPILNVYHYQVISLDAPVDLQVYAEDIVNSWWAHTGAQVSALQSQYLKHVRVELLNLSNQLEIGDRIWDTPIAGGTVGDYCPANLSFSFRLQRYSRIVRNGRKSIAGVADAHILAGRTLNPTFSTYVSAVSEALGSLILIEGDTTDASFLPVIVRKPENPGVVPTQFSPVTKAYLRGFGTMNTRKAL